MAESWDFQKDYEDIKTIRKKAEAKLRRKKLNVLKKLVKSTIKIGMISYVGGAESYRTTFKGTLAELYPDYIKLTNLQSDIVDTTYININLDNIYVIEKVM